jgi:hypothetical protein
MNATALAILASLLGVVIFAPKRWALLGLFAGVLYLTLGQFIDFFEFHLYPIRVLTLAAFVRVLARGEWSLSKVNEIDKVLLFVYGYRTAVFILNSNGPATNALGPFFDVTLSYFACRGLLHNFQDLRWFLRALTLLLIPYIGLLSLEAVTGQNPFVAIGGMDVYAVRDGRPRGSGSFAHALTLGTFGASFIPLFLALLCMPKWRVWGAHGLALCAAIVFFANSSGPLLCATVAVAGSLCWFVRTRMFVVNSAIAAGFVMVAILMKAPIWFLPTKIGDLIGGGDAWHRSYLMNIAFEHVNQWWLVGMPLVDTKNWFPYVVVTGGADLINYYLDFGIAAGMPAMALFIFLLVRAFARVGRALRVARSGAPIDQGGEMLLWALGSVLAVHVFNWFSLVYFDQYHVVFFMQLAALSTLSQRCIQIHRRHLQPSARSANVRPSSTRFVARRT